MKKVALLGGAGLMGAGIARDLLAEYAICELEILRICDLREDLVGGLVSELDDPRLEAYVLDVSDKKRLSEAISGFDLCINAVPTLAGFQMQIFGAAREQRCAYMDLGGLGIYTSKQKAAHRSFVDAGVTAVISTGSDPGMSNVLCRAVADELDSVERINLYWAAELVGEENPVLVPPYSISTVLAEYARPSTQFLHGKHVECPPMTGLQTLELPEPWGRTEFMYSPHSEQLTVPLAQGIREKGIREFTWRLHLPHREHEAWLGLVKAGFGDFDEPVEVQGVEVKPLDVLSAVIGRNMQRNAERMPAQESHEIHFAIGTGEKAGVPKSVRCEVIVRPHPMYASYVDAGTSMNASIAAQLLLNAPPKPGVWAPEEFFNVDEYLAQLRVRHFDVSITSQ